jgi:selenocysteine lyase/cysteine desulfurase
LQVEKIRKQLPVVQKRVYLDNAGTGPPTLKILREVQSYIDDWRDVGERPEKWLKEVVRARTMFAQAINGSADEVACVPNVTTGMAAVASALPMVEDSNVVLTDLNFPTNIYLWHTLRRRGIIREVRILKNRNGVVPPADFERAIDERTAAVSLDYVSWTNGCREQIADVAEVVHRYGGLMMVDAFHALGAMPVDVKEDGIDVLTTGSYKWLMGPHTAAFAYVKKEVLPRLNPMLIGWHGTADTVITRMQAGRDPFDQPFDLTDAPIPANATRFEWGSWPFFAVIGARAALEFLKETGAKERFERILKLTDRLIQGLSKADRKVTSPLQPERRSGIVTFEDRRPSQTARKLGVRKITVAARSGTIRVSPHFYNTEEEIDKFLRALKSIRP